MKLVISLSLQFSPPEGKEKRRNIQVQLWCCSRAECDLRKLRVDLGIEETHPLLPSKLYLDALYFTVRECDACTQTGLCLFSVSPPWVGLRSEEPRAMTWSFKKLL